MVHMRRPRVGGTKAPPPKIHNLFTRPFPPASMSYEGDGLTSREEGTATCREDYEAKSRVIASTTRTCRLDGSTSASTGWPFPIGVATTVLPCFASTFAQNGRLGAPECTNSTISGTCVVGCTGPERAPSDNHRTPPSVSENDGVTFLVRGYFSPCVVTRCLTSTGQAPIGVSKDCEDIPDGSSCRVAGAAGFKLHTDLSCFAIRQLESNSVPPYSMYDEKRVR